jgi:hypothetical protein
VPDRPEAPVDVERVLMDRARRQAARQDERLPRPVLPRVIGFALAVLVVVVLLFAFDRFLSIMQRYLDLPVTDPAPAATEPMPAYVVPDEPAAAPPPGDGADVPDDAGAGRAD